MRHELGFRFLLLVLVPSMILPASKGYFFSTKEKRVLSMYLFFFFSFILSSNFSLWWEEIGYKWKSTQGYESNLWIDTSTYSDLNYKDVFHA